MPPKTRAKGRKTGAQKKKKNPSPGESLTRRSSEGVQPSGQQDGGVFVLVLSFVLLTQGHYGTQAGLKHIFRLSLPSAGVTGAATTLG